MKKQTISELVAAHKEELTGKNLKELFSWAQEMGLGNQSAFPRFKKALSEHNICDWNKTKAESAEKRGDELASQAKHEMRLVCDGWAQQDRFAICKESGEPVWFGKFFGDDTSGGNQATAELNTALKAIWLAGKTGETLGESSIRLHLQTDAQWLTTLSGKAEVLSKSASRFRVDLELEWIPSQQNKADSYSRARGFKKWSDTPASELVTPLASEPPEQSAPAISPETPPAQKPTSQVMDNIQKIIAAQPETQAPLVSKGVVL